MQWNCLLEDIIRNTETKAPLFIQVKLFSQIQQICTLCPFADYGWPLPSDLCPIWIYLDVLFSTASIMHLCAISLDRYIAIRNPIHHSRFNSHTKARIKIMAVWTISVGKYTHADLNTNYLRSIYLSVNCGILKSSQAKNAALDWIWDAFNTNREKTPTGSSMQYVSEQSNKDMMGWQCGTFWVLAEEATTSNENGQEMLEVDIALHIDLKQGEYNFEI